MNIYTTVAACAGKTTQQDLICRDFRLKNDTIVLIEVLEDISKYRWT